MKHTSANLVGWEINKQVLIDKYQAINKKTPTEKMLIVEANPNLVQPTYSNIKYVPDESLT